MEEINFRPIRNPITGKAGSYRNEQTGQVISRRQYQKEIGKPLPPEVRIGGIGTTKRARTGRTGIERAVFTRGTMHNPVTLREFRAIVQGFVRRAHAIGRPDVLVGVTVERLNGTIEWSRPSGGFIEVESLLRRIDDAESMVDLTRRWEEGYSPIIATGGIQIQLVPGERSRAA